MKTFTELLRCYSCRYEEEHDLERGTTLDGLKCPNCDEAMTAVDNGEDGWRTEEEEEEPEDLVPQW